MSKYDAIYPIEEYLIKSGIPLKEGYSYKQYLKRQSGYKFTFEEHLQAMIYSLLSANRPWSGIVQRMPELDHVFHNYDEEFLINADPTRLADDVTSIGCGNKALYKQMSNLATNVRTFRRILDEAGDIDALIDYAGVNAYMHLLTDNGPCRIYGFKEALALQYLRNVGVDTCKPDVHIRRIMYRLGWILWEDESAENVVRQAELCAQYTGWPVTYVNEILWTYCATGYAEVCGKTPQCRICKVQDCRWRSRQI